MTWNDALHLGWANLRQTPLRTVLTVTGVAIGIGMLVCMFGFGLGLQQLNTEQVSRYRFLNAIQVFNADAGFGPGSPGRAKGPAPPLDETALQKLRRLPGVSAAAPVVQFPAELRHGKSTRAGLGRSFTQSLDGRNPLYKLSAGRFFTSPRAREILLSEESARGLGFKDPKSAVGRQVSLVLFATAAGGSAASPAAGAPGFSVQRQEVPCRVAGVLESTEGPFGSPMLRMEVLLPLDTALELGLHRLGILQQLMRSPGTRGDYTQVEVQTVRPTDAERVEAAIRKMGYRTVSLASVLQEINKVFIIMDAVLGAIGSVSLIVACLGIVNTMIIAVLERRKEIGIAKSVGARRRDIKHQFFVEGGLIGILGGTGGVVLGWLVSQGINFGLNVYVQQQGIKPETLFRFPAWLLGAAVALAVGVSLASALYPAARAARLDPVESLRYE